MAKIAVRMTDLALSETSTLSFKRGPALGCKFQLSRSRGGQLRCAWWSAALVFFLLSAPELRANEAVQAEAQALAADLRAALNAKAEERQALGVTAADPALETAIGRLVTEVVFPHGAVAVGDADRLRLEGVAETLRTLADNRITVVGYSDRTGTLSANTVLSQRRADIVASVLVEAGLPDERVLTLSALDEGLPLPVPTDEGVSEPRNRSARVFLQDR